jgi:hypothetical protein
MLVNVNATLNPRKLSPRSSNKLKHVRVTKVQVENHGTILINSTTTKDLV